MWKGEYRVCTNVNTWMMIRFAWDKAKNAANIRKHGIDFADAIDVFTHPVLSLLDDREDYSGTLGSNWLDASPGGCGGIHRARRRCDPDYLRPKGNDE